LFLVCSGNIIRLNITTSAFQPSPGCSRGRSHLWRKRTFCMHTACVSTLLHWRGIKNLWHQRHHHQSGWKDCTSGRGLLKTTGTTPTSRSVINHPPVHLPPLRSWSAGPMLCRPSPSIHWVWIDSLTSIVRSRNVKCLIHLFSLFGVIGLQL
jgi:hypothetical protein